MILSITAIERFQYELHSSSVFMPFRGIHMETTASSKVYPVNEKDQLQMEIGDSFPDESGIWRDLTSISPM